MGRNFLPIRRTKHSIEPIHGFSLYKHLSFFPQSKLTERINDQFAISEA